MVTALRESYWVYPLVNTLHIVGIALLFGSIVPLDLRLAGWRREDATLDLLARVLLPVAVFGFALAALAGLVLFAVDARAYAGSLFFQSKLVLIVLALANAWLLRRVAWRAGQSSDRRLALAGAISILLWLGVIFLGRMIGYS